MLKDKSPLKISTSSLPPAKPGRNNLNGPVSHLHLFIISNKFALKVWIVWQALIFLIPAVSLALISLPQTEQNSSYSIGWIERIFGIWVHWDSVWYISIARQGYAVEHLAAFYPLYPLLIKLAGLPFSLVLPLYEALTVAGILISSLLALLSFAGLYRLVLMDYEEETARLSLIFMLVYPVSFFLSVIYTEALFLALVTGSLLAARHNRWAIALVLCALAVLTKNQAIALGAALLVEYMGQLKWDVRRLDRRLVYFSLPVAAFAGWLAANQLFFNNPFHFVFINGVYWDHHFSWPWETAAAVFNDLFGLGSIPGWMSVSPIQTTINLLEYPVTLAFLVLLIASLVWWRKKIRPSYQIYFLLCMALPLSSPLIEHPLYSMPRYSLIIFPAFIMMAMIGKRWRWLNQVYLAICLPVLVLLSILFAAGYWAS